MANRSLVHNKTSICVVVLCSLGIVAAATAQSVVTKGWKTFSGPVRIPGVTLPAGTYVFETVGASAGQQFLRISQKEGGRQVALVMVTTAGPHAVATTGRRAANDPEVTFRDTPAGKVRAVGAVYFGTEGYEFLYSAEEDRAMRRDLAVAVVRR